LDAQEHVKVDWRRLRALARAIFLGAGLPDAEAEIIADSLVAANLAGVHSHGVSRISDYLERMDRGLVTRATKIDVVRETATMALLDANNGWGQVASQRAVELVVGKARDFGSAWVGVRNSNHYGTAAYWTSRIASEGMIGISSTNASPVMAPFGSRRASLGTNPISIAVPSGSSAPVVLDMATSIQARGKIILADKNGESIPEGWAITKDGRPTTDPREALEGSMLPAAGPKGSGLAIMLDVLTGVLTGARFGLGVPRMYEDSEPQQLGHIFAAINTEVMMPLDEFIARMSEKERETRESPPAEGFDRVLMPGDVELEKGEAHRSSGIPLGKEVYEELLSTANRYGVSTKVVSSVRL
jgi:LDH2 family malate/lactate/ureidoglycolate dehydrogenase